MDTVFVQNIQLHATIGLDCWHREKPQPASVTVRVPTSVAAAGRSDKIADTRDYRPVYKAVLALQGDTAAHPTAYPSLPEFAGAVCGRISEVTGAPSLEVVVMLPKAVRQAEGLRIDMRMQSTGGFGPSDSILSSILVVKGLKVECIIGIGEEERRAKQPVALDLELRGPPEDFNHRDYQTWFGGILVKVCCVFSNQQTTMTNNQQKLETTSYSTIEAFATEVARFLIVNQQWTEVSVGARKPSIFSASDGPGVEILRSADYEW